MECYFYLSCCNIFVILIFYGVIIILFYISCLVSNLWICIYPIRKSKLALIPCCRFNETPSRPLLLLSLPVSSNPQNPKTEKTPNPNWGNPKTFSRSPSPARRRRFFHAHRSFPLVGVVDVLVFSLLPCFVAAVVALSYWSMNGRRNLVALLLFVAGGVAVVLLFSPVLSHLRRLETSRCPCSSLLLVEQR